MLRPYGWRDSFVHSAAISLVSYNAAIAKRAQFTILVDEHIAESIVASIEELGWFKVIRAAKDHRYRGRDELDYIGELRSRGIVFVTEDGRFVRRIMADRVRHAGIVWLAAEWSIEEKAAAAWVACAYLHGYLRQRHRGARDVIIRPELDGIHTIEDGRERLAMSLDELERIMSAQHDIPTIR